MVLNNQESRRRKYWTTQSSICLLTPLIHSLPSSWKSELLDDCFFCVFFSVLDHSGSVKCFLNVVWRYAWGLENAILSCSIKRCEIASENGIKRLENVIVYWLMVWPKFLRFFIFLFFFIPIFLRTCFFLFLSALISFPVSFSFLFFFFFFLRGS